MQVVRRVAPDPLAVAWAGGNPTYICEELHW